ncbi:MAG: ATP-binding protein [Dehalococcoidia bacterium]
MESLADILKRLRQQSISAAESLPASWANAIDEAEEPDCAICGGRGWVRRDVPTNHLDFGKAFPCICQREASAEERVTRLQRFSNMGMLSQATFDRISPDGPGTTTESQGRYRAALEAAKAFAEHPSGAFVILGGSGAGKTYLAAAIANRLMERDEPAFFAFVPDLLDHLRATYNPDSELSYDELFDLVKTIPALILDDFSLHNSSPWAEEKLYQVLNHRHLSGLPTIVTSNAPIERLDARLQSRLLDPRASRVIDLGGSVQSAVPGIGAIEQELLRNMTFERFDPNGQARDREGRDTLQGAMATAQAFSRDPEGWLVLVGDSGCGKTHLAIAVANERLRQGSEVFFAFVPDLLDHLRYTFSPESRVTYDVLFDQVKQAQLLILDDLGAESPTQWANEKLYQVIVHRHNARLPTIITTRAIPTAANDPIASRLNDPRLVTVMPITAPDYRQPGGRVSQSRPAKGRGR